MTATYVTAMAGVSAAALPADDMGPRIMTTHLPESAVRMIGGVPDPGAGPRVEMKGPRIPALAVLPQWHLTPRLHEDVCRRIYLTGRGYPMRTNGMCGCPYCL